MEIDRREDVPTRKCTSARVDVEEKYASVKRVPPRELPCTGFSRRQIKSFLTGAKPKQKHDADSCIISRLCTAIR